MLTGHPDEAANNSNTPPPLLEAPFQVRFHAYVLNVWTARQRFQGSEYFELGGFLDTSASHLSGEQSYIFSYKIWEVKPPRFLERPLRTGFYIRSHTKQDHVMSHLPAEDLQAARRVEQRPGTPARGF